MIIFVDKYEKGSDQYDHGKMIREILEEHYGYKGTEKIRYLYGPTAKIFFGEGFGDEEKLVVFIHGCLFGYDELGLGGAFNNFGEIEDLAQTIRERRLDTRIVIYSDADKYPLDLFIEKVKADGYLTKKMFFGEILHFIEKGNVTPEEIQERGITVGLVDGTRVGKRYDINKERSGD